MYVENMLKMNAYKCNKTNGKLKIHTSSKNEFLSKVSIKTVRAEETSTNPRGASVGTPLGPLGTRGRFVSGMFPECFWIVSG